MKHNLNEIKHDYQNIPVPKELKSRVETAVNRAKAELEQSAGNTQGTAFAASPQKPAARVYRYLFRGLGGVAAAALAITLLANSNASISHAMEQIPVLGAFVKVVTFREYQHTENQMQADLKIPEVEVKDENGKVLEDATDDLNKSIQDYTDEIIASYEADVKAAGGEGTEAVNLDYDVVTDNEKLFSLRFHQEITMAGAAQSQKIYHIDKTTGKMITLKDLFRENADYQTVISENIKAQMKQQMAEDDSKTYFIDSEVPEWDFQKISDQVNFYVNESGKLMIVFDEYEVAPGYMGIVSFEIPTEAVKHIVKEGYLK